MALLNPYLVRTIAWAQWRSILNQRSRQTGFPLAAVLTLLWYSVWSGGAALIALFCSDPQNVGLLRSSLGSALLAGFVYWQLAPIAMASGGLSLDLPRLIVYPIEKRNLFAIEVLLRASTAIEMLLLSFGLFVGLATNPAIPDWSPFALVPYVASNLFVSAGLRDLLRRLFARKGVRELSVVILVLLSALPQILLSIELPERYARALERMLLGSFWPWSSAAALLSGSVTLAAVLLLFGSTIAAYCFGTYQFYQTLRLDNGEIRNAPIGTKRRDLAGILANALGSHLPDPLGALVEKDLRSLGRSARFRLLFLMGFSFGMLIWLPMAMRAEEHSLLQSNYLTVVNAYALMLLGEILFWNHLGIDRSAAGLYFVAPVTVTTVLVAKNLAAAVFIALESCIIVVFSLLVRVQVSLLKIAEALSVAAVLTIFLLAAGNLLSARYPRPIDPAKSWRASSRGSVQAFLLLIYPVISVPVGLAYAARYAFQSEFAFYGVLSLSLFLGAAVYWVALDSAAAWAETHKEELVFALSQGQGPVST